MSKDIIILFTAWFLIFAIFIGGMGLALSYHVKHFDSCWSCGERIDKQNDYCTHCGVDLTPVCEKCGAECTTAFCGSCGAPMNQEASDE